MTSRILMFICLYVFAYSAFAETYDKEYIHMLHHGSDISCPFSFSKLKTVAIKNDQRNMVYFRKSYTTQWQDFVTDVLTRTLAGDLPGNGEDFYILCASGNFPPVRISPWFPDMATWDPSEVKVPDKITPENFNRGLDILKNLGKSVKDVPGLTVPPICSKRHDLIENYRSKVDAVELPSDAFSSFFNLKTLALFLGDGTINGEIDLEGYELEGGDPRFTLPLLIQAIKQMDFSQFDSHPVGENILKKIVQQLEGAYRHFSIFADLEKSLGSDVFDAYESTMITFLRQMAKGDELLLPLAFSNHAMAMEIKKTDFDAYQFTFFNSGSGLEYHQFTGAGYRVKYIPVRRFSMLTLGLIKDKALLRRLGEMSGVGGLDFSLGKSKKVFNQKHLHEIILASIAEWEVIFKDDAEFRAILNQRSGTCSVRSLLAYISTKVKDYRTFKLLLNQVFIKLAVSKKWGVEDIAVARKIIKFSYENHARSMLKFVEEKRDVNLNIFGDSTFFDHYRYYSFQIWEKKPDSFELALDSAKPTKKYHDDIISRAGEIELLYKAFFGQKPAIGDPTEAACKVHMERITKPIMEQNILDILESLLAIKDKCWKLREIDMLAFLSSFVLNRLPLPSYDENNQWVSMMKALSPKEHDAFAQKIFELVKTLLDLQNGSNARHPEVFISVKILAMILHVGFCNSFPEASQLVFSPKSLKLFKLAFNPHLFIDLTILNKLEDIETMKKKGEKLKNIKDVLNSPIIAGILAKMIGDSKIEVRTVLKHRVNPSLSSFFYYWRAVIEAMYRIRECHYCITFPQAFDPNTSIFTDDNMKYNECHNYPSLPMDPYNSFAAMNRSGREKDILDPPHRNGPNIKDNYCELEADLEKFGFSLDEIPIYHNVLYGGVDQIGRFIRALQEYDEYFDWASVLFLGIGAINQASRDAKSLRRLAVQLNESMTVEYSQIEKLGSEFSKTTGNDPAVMRVVRKYSASFVLLGSIGRLVPSEPDVSSMLKKHQDSTWKLIQTHGIQKEYLVYMVFSYVNSFSLQSISETNASSILVANALLLDSSHHLPTEFERTIFMFGASINAVQAAYTLYQAENQDGLNFILNGWGNQDKLEGSNFWVKFPLALGKSGNQYNLVTGEVFNAQGKGITRLPFLQAQNLLRKIGSELEQRSVHEIFRSITNDATGSPSTLTTLKLMPRKIVGDDTIEIQFLENGKDLYARKICRDGETKYFIRDARLLAASPIPALNLKAEDYNIWASLSADSISFESLKERYISQHGRMLYPADELRDLQLMEFDKTKSMNPLSDEMILLKNSESWYLLFKRFEDPSSTILWFKYKLTWRLLSDETYSISSNQIFEDSGYTQDYLLLQNEDGQRKVILPVKFYYTEKNDGKRGFSVYKLILEQRQTKFSSQHLSKRVRTELLSLEGDKLSSSSRYYDLLLSYRFLVSRDYQRSFTYLNRLHHMEPLEDHELQVLAWILTSNDSNRDGSPESCAIRAYASFKVFSNMSLFKFEQIESSFQEQDPDPLVKPYEDGIWSRYWTSGTTKMQIQQTMEAYVLLYRNIPINLRFDYKSDRGLMTKDEMDVWFKNLASEKVDSFKEGRLLGSQRYRARTTVPFTKYSNGEAVTCSQILSNLKEEYEATETKQSYFKDLNLNDVSWLEVDYWETKKKNFTCYLIGAKMISEQTLLTYKRFLRSFIGTKESEVAYFGLELIKNTGKVKNWVDDICTCRLINDNGKHCSELLEMVMAETNKTIVRSKVKHMPLYIPSSMTKSLVEKGKPTGPLTTPSSKHPTGFSLDIFKDGLGQRLDEAELDAVLKDLDQLASTSLDHIKNISETHGSNSSNFIIRLERIGHGTPLLLESELAHLYVHGDKENYFGAFPSVPENLYQSIHNDIHSLILAKTYRNDILRLKSAFKANDKIKMKAEVEAHRWNQDIRIKLSSRAQRIILTYELFINSRLTKEQLLDIDCFCKKEGSIYVSRIIQRMMAAGKTFILGTLLATIKADKESLSLLVVPRALYTQEASNIIHRTKNAFGAEGFSFHVDRQTKLESLNWLCHSLHNAILQGRYVIVAPETLLVLHNMFAESLLSSESKYQVLKDIIALLRTKGAGTFDEIDISKDPIQQVNFPLSVYPGASAKGSTGSNYLLVKQAYIMAEISVSLLKLYSEHKDRCKIGKSPFCSDFSKNVLIKTEDYSKMRPLIIDEIIQKIVKRTFDLPVLEETDQHILNFESLDHPEILLQKFLSIDERAKDAGMVFMTMKASVSIDTYILLATIRLAINEWIPQAWNQNVNESYGVSEIIHDDGKIRNYAIPFIGGKTPKINSEFSFKWLCFIRTMRTYLTNGFTRSAAEKSIKWIYNLALSEVKLNGHLKEGYYEKLMEAAFGLKMMAIDLDDPTILEQIVRTLEVHHNSEAKQLSYLIFMMSWIAQDLIPGIPFYPYQISANPLDMSILLASIQGYSGTISTVKIFPEIFHDKKNKTHWLLDERIDTQIKDKILANSPFDAIIVPDSVASEDFFQIKEISMFIKDQESMRRPFIALIDVGAYFKDESNESVAETLLNFRTKDSSGYSKTHVLYFDSAENKLAVKKHGQSAKIFQSVSRKTIEEEAPNEETRVTYYDQLHTTGVDIFQHEKGFAILIIGLKTSLRDFNQAVMRLRKLLTAEQRVIIVVPTCVEAAIYKLKGNNEKIKPSDVLEYLKVNLLTKSRQQNMTALFNIIGTKCKEFALNRILTENSTNCTCPETWLKKTESPVEDLVAHMVDMPISEAAEVFKKKALGDISECLKEAESIIKSKSGLSESALFIKKLNQIVSNAIKDAEDYPETVLLSSQNSDSTVETKVETTKLLETNNQQEVEIVKHFRNNPVFENINLDLADIPLLRGQDIEIKDNGIVLLKDYIDEYPGFGFVRGMFDDRIGFSKCFIDTLFGEARKMAQYVLHLIKDEEEMFIVVSSHVVKSAMKALSAGNDMLYGFKATLIDNTGNVMSPPGSKFDFDKNRKILSEILVFTGSYRMLGRPEWARHVGTWVTADLNRRSTFFKNIVLSQKELKRFELLPIAEKFKTGLSATTSIMESPEFTMLYYSCKQVDLARSFYQKYIRDKTLGILNRLKFVDMDTSVLIEPSTNTHSEAVNAFYEYLMARAQENNFDGEYRQIQALMARILTRRSFDKEWEKIVEYLLMMLTLMLENNPGALIPDEFFAVMGERLSRLRPIRNLTAFDTLLELLAQRKIWEDYPEFYFAMVPMLNYERSWRDKSSVPEFLKQAALPEFSEKTKELYVRAVAEMMRMNQLNNPEINDIVWPAIVDHLSKADFALLYKAMLANDRQRFNRRFGFLEQEAKIKIFDRPLVEISGHDSEHFLATLLNEAKDWEDLRSIARVFENHASIKLDPALVAKIDKDLSKNDVEILKNKLAAAVATAYMHDL